MATTVDESQRVENPHKPNGAHPVRVPETLHDATMPIESEDSAVKVVHALVQNSRIREARARTDEFLERSPDSRPLRTAARILAPGVATVVPSTGPKRSRAIENQWLQSHAREYPGQWMLVFEDRLIAAGPDLNEVIEKGRSEGGADGVLWFQPDGEWWKRKNT